MGRTALHYASALQKIDKKESEDKVKALKDAGADNNCKDLNNETPDSLSKGSFDVMKFRDDNSKKYIERNAEVSMTT